MIPPLCFKRGGALDTRASAALSLTRNATEGCLTHPQFLFCHFKQGRGAQHPTNLFHSLPPHDLSCNLCDRGEGFCAHPPPCSNCKLEPGGLVSPMPTPESDGGLRVPPYITINKLKLFYFVVGK